MIRLTGAPALLAMALVFQAGNGHGDSPLRTPDLAWERGDYVTALSAYQQLLSSPEADRVLEPIALQTGELFHTTELTTDGTSPQFSPDSRFITYETGAALTRIIRILPADGSTKPIAELSGFGAVFSPDGSRLAYFNVAPSDELKAAYAAVDELPAAERPTRTTALAARIGSETRIVIRDMASGREAPVDTGTLRKIGLAFGAGGMLLFSGGPDGAPLQIYAAFEDRAPTPLTTGDG